METYRKGRGFIYKVFEYCSENFMLPIVQFPLELNTYLNHDFFTD